MRARRAPMAVRMAISLRREKVRARRRFATLAHAMRRTKATAPSIIRSAGRTLPTVLFAQRVNDCAPSLVLGGIGLLEMLGDGIHLCLCLLEGDAGLEASDCKIVVVAADGGFGGCECFGDPHLGEAGFVHCRAHDTDDGVGLVIEIDGFADGCRVGGVVGLPEFIAEDDFVVLARVVLLRTEGASVDGFDSEDGEEAVGDGACSDGFGFSGTG